LPFNFLGKPQMHKVELDMVVVSGQPADIQVEVDQWLAFHKISGVQHTILALEGPGGGWPLIRFTSQDKAPLEAVVDAWTPEDLDLAAELKAAI
jgi:hypothetical protein